MGDDLASLSARFLADRKRLSAYIFALVHSGPVVEDIFQDVYLALTRAVERGEVIANLPAWCRGVSRNLALQHWQEGRRLERLPSADLFDAIDQSFAEVDDAEDEALLRALAECRGSMPRQVLALLDLRYVHDLSMRDIAERTRRSERAVITALGKVRRRLQDCIQIRLAGQAHV